MPYVDELFKIITERLNPWGMRTFTSLIEDFRFHRIRETEFVTSLLLLFKKGEYLHQRFKVVTSSVKEDDEDSDIEEGKIRDGDPKIQAEANHLEVTVKVDQDQNPKEEDPIHGESKIEADREVRVEVDENRKKYISYEYLDGPIERPLKKTRRTSKRLERVTPNYTLIPKELQSPVSSTVLNSTCVVKKYDIEGGKKLTGIEEKMNKCEDHMYEVYMLMGALRSAVESAGRVMRGEMRLEDLGVKFYRCVEMLHGGDMFKIVTEDHQRALPVILNRLNLKLREITVARESWKPLWKQTFKKLSAKQRDSTAQKSEVKKTTI